MELQYRWTPPDVEALFQVTTDNLLCERKKRVNFGRFYFLGLFILLAVIVNANQWFLCLLLLGLAAVSAIKYPAFIRWRWIKQMRNQFDDSAITVDRKLTITDERVIFETPTQRTDTARSEVVGLQRTDTTYLIAFRNGQYGIVPRAALHTNDEEQAFLQLFEIVS